MRTIAIVLAVALATFLAVLYVRWPRGDTVAAQAGEPRAAAKPSSVAAPDKKVTSNAPVRQAPMTPNEAASTVVNGEDKPRISAVYTNPEDMKRHDAWLRSIIPQRNPGEQGPTDLDLVMAVVHGKTAWLGKMLDSGISPNTEVQLGYPREINGHVENSTESLFEFAVESGQVDIAKDLVERGAYINQPADDGATPLTAAAGYGETSLVSFLLDHGAGVNIDQPDNTNRTALRYAIDGGYYHTAQLLLSHGASVGAALGRDLTLPPELANPRNSQYTAIRDLMVAHGAVMPQGGN